MNSSALAPDTIVMVTTHVPSIEIAKQMAAHLVENKLAACVNIVSGCVSVYRWEGRIEEADEVALSAKTQASRLRALEDAINALHPYDVPDILALPVVHANAQYADWVRRETNVPVHA
jgi:periplasmic divalent cation tolerance protein